MRRISAVYTALAVSAIMWQCGKTTKPAEASGADSTSVDTIASRVEVTRLPDTTYASVQNLVYEIVNADTTTSAEIDIYLNDYAGVDGIPVFRGTERRDADMRGTVKGTPAKIEKVWSFRTFQPSSERNKWGSGSGWNGQPVLVHWPDSVADRFRRESSSLTGDFAPVEVIQGSLAGHVYFINFETGKASRRHFDLVNTVKGSVSLDPDFSHPTLYVGQGIPCGAPFGCMAIDLVRHERSFFHSDSRSWRSWGAFDSSPLVHGGFLFWPGENGTFSKFSRHNGKITLHTALRFKQKGSRAGGIESSVAVYRNYGYFGDNLGNILCVNLDTMRPVWHYSNHDDTDGSIVVDEEEGRPVIYTGCEVDKQGTSGNCYFVKLNGLDGSLIWEQKIPCRRWDTPDQHFDGGQYASPLLGHGDCEGLIFVPVCFSTAIPKGEFFAFDTKTGEIRYRTQLLCYCWSSPVGFYNENNELFIFQGDCSGNVYLIRGKTGEIIFRERMGHNFESSPAVRGNSAVVGTRGNEIYRFDII